MSFLQPEPMNPRMRAVAWATIILFIATGLLRFAGLIDLHASAFPLLMGYFAVAFVAQAWARKGGRSESNG